MNDVGGSAPAENFAERRSSRRKKSFLRGKIIYDRGAHSCECTIRDVSDGGARVELPVGQIIPKKIFLVEMRGGIAYECEVRWRAPSSIGVLFLRSFPLGGPLPDEYRYLKQIWGGETLSAQIELPPEITPEMIGAGVAAYGAWKPASFAWIRTEQEMVRAVYAAMHLAKPKQR